MEPRYVLIVGGAGYIGSHMVLTLKQAGFTPIVFDNLSKGHRDAIIDTELIVGDTNDKSLLNDLFSTRKFTAVMHFASLIETSESVKNPILYYQNNVAESINLIEAMIKNKVNNLIFSSSAAVYGDPKSHHISEAHVLAPITPYGRSKWMIEEVIKDVGMSNGLNYAILRYFNAAGADPQGRLGEWHEPESHLIPLVLQVAKGLKKHVTIFGDNYKTPDGTCIRDYVHVIDLCNAHLLSLRSLMKYKKNIICNLGSGHGFSVLQVINAASRVTGKNIPFVKGGPRTGDPAILVADITLAKHELRWRPRYSDLETIIQHAWHAMEKHKT
jgi:UDP-glucose 4-epimerase